MESENPLQSREVKLHNGEGTLRCLPEEVIAEEILPRLPVKSLLKFRCVSKPWCSLIDSKGFMKAHLKYSIKTAPHWIFFNYGERRFKQCSLPSLFDNPFTDPITHNLVLGNNFYSDMVSPVGCCNGLVCFAINEITFILWNPTTRIFKYLPDCIHNAGFVTVLKYGFGFDESSDDYKVFVAVNTVNHYLVVRVYSLRSNLWMDIEERDERDCQLGDEGKFVSGKLHWYKFPCGILSFDLNRHVYGVVELPSCSKGICHGLGVIGGCLSAHFLAANVWDLDVWLMKEYGVKESWNKVVTVPRYEHLVFTTIPIIPIPVAIAPNGEILLSYDLDVMIYNPNSGVFRRAQVTGLDGLVHVRSMGICIESLASLSSRGQGNIFR